MRVAVLLLLVLTAACSHTRLDYSGTAATGSASSNSAGLAVPSRPFSLVVLGTLLIATVVDGGPRAASFSDWGWRSAPEMNPDRAISEQDCTKPIELSENLRCR